MVKLWPCPQPLTQLGEMAQTDSSNLARHQQDEVRVARRFNFQHENKYESSHPSPGLVLPHVCSSAFLSVAWKGLLHIIQWHLIWIFSHGLLQKTARIRNLVTVFLNSPNSAILIFKLRDHEGYMHQHKGAAQLRTSHFQASRWTATQKQNQAGPLTHQHTVPKAYGNE